MPLWFSSNLKARLQRLFKHWAIFTIYVLICAHIFMHLEGGLVDVDDDEKAVVWNQMLDKLISSANDTMKQKKAILKAALLLSGDDDQSWDLVNSLYYCSSLYTTVGYGDMVCATSAGRLFSIFFIVSSVPMWFNILAQLGYFLHLLLFKLWALLRGFSEAGYFFKERRRTFPMTPPLIFTTILALLCVTIMSCFMSYADDTTFFESFYFTIVTFSTVGLGDVVPKTHFGKLRCSLLSFNVGFAILSGWITNAADVIYARRLSEAAVVEPIDNLEETEMVRPQFFLRSHTQRAKHLRKVMVGKQYHHHHHRGRGGGCHQLRSSKSSSSCRKLSSSSHHQIMRSSGPSRAPARSTSMPAHLAPLRLRLLVPKNDDFYNHHQAKKGEQLIKEEEATDNSMEMKTPSTTSSTVCTTPKGQQRQELIVNHGGIRSLSTFENHACQ